jgi:hypothetical protein
MHRRAGITTIACLAVAMLALPSGASALTKVVYAGAPKAQTQTLAAKLLGKGAKGFRRNTPPPSSPS